MKGKETKKDSSYGKPSERNFQDTQKNINLTVNTAWKACMEKSATSTVHEKFFQLRSLKFY